MFTTSFRCLMCVTIALAGAQLTSAAQIVTGHFLLLPNQAGQTVNVMVSGGENVAGVNLYAQVGDGGPELADYGLPAGTDGPSIAAVDLKAGTIFASVPDPQVNQGSLPQVAVWSLGIAAQGGHVSAQGKLATLTIDTTGFARGRWDLKLSDVLPQLDGGPFATDFAGVAATIANGSIRINAGAPGDTDADGDVDLEDLNNVRNHFGETGGNPLGDTFPFDDAVGLDDLNAVRNHFGAPGGANSVPEPATAALAIALIATVAASRRSLP